MDLMDYNQIFTDMLDEKEKDLLDILKAHELSKEMAKEEQKYAKLHELAYADEVYTVKTKAPYYAISNMVESYAKNAQNFLHMDEAKKKDFSDGESACSYLREIICHNILNLSDDVKSALELKDVLFCGLDGYACEIKFTYYSHLYEITIPFLSKMNVKNYSFSENGKIRLGHYPKESLDDEIKASYSILDIEKAFKEFNTPIPV